MVIFVSPVVLKSWSQTLLIRHSDDVGGYRWSTQLLTVRPTYPNRQPWSPFLLAVQVEMPSLMLHFLSLHISFETLVAFPSTFSKATPQKKNKKQFLKLNNLEIVVNAKILDKYGFVYIFLTFLLGNIYQDSSLSF